MITATGSSLQKFLRHAGLITGVMALIAGVIGMHTLSGSHDVHTTFAPVTTVLHPSISCSGAAGTSLDQRTYLDTGRDTSLIRGHPPCIDPATGAVMPDGCYKTCMPALADSSVEGPGPGRALLASRTGNIAALSSCPVRPVPTPSLEARGISRM